LHPARSFNGRDGVRRNWEAIFDAHPDIQVTLTTRAQSGDGIWGEWEFKSKKSSSQHSARERCSPPFAEPRQPCTDISAPDDGSERIQAAMSSAQDPARHPSTEKAQKEEPACASLVPPRNR